MKKCSLLDMSQFTKYNNPRNDEPWYCPYCIANTLPFTKYNNPRNDEPWYCPYCIANTLPFNNLSDTHFLLLQNELIDEVSDDLKLYPDESFNHFTETCETLTINFDDNDVNDDILNHVNSKYYNIHNFNKIKPVRPSSIGFLHTNIASITNFPCSEVLNGNSDPNWQAKAFTEIILNIMTNFIPNETIIVKPRNPPWITKPINTVKQTK